MAREEYDAVIVGSGPNGLAAAITLRRAGLSVLVVEGKATPGGGMRSEALTLPGFVHDICSAVHPMVTLSPFFTDIPLKDFGLEMINPHFAAAHPFDDGSAGVLGHSLTETAKALGVDKDTYLRIMGVTVDDLPRLLPDLLGPFPFPNHPIALARFGLKALTSASWMGNRFQSRQARGLWAGMAAHSIQPLTNLATSAFGLILMSAAHIGNWPVARGGSQAIANALVSYFISIGGKIETNFHVRSLAELPAARAVLLDVTPKQLLEIAGDRLNPSYADKLRKYRYGMGVFKIDWALSEPIPFTNKNCRNAGTIHLGNTMEEIIWSEKITSEGKLSNKPFVLLAQPSLFDPSRAPAGKHTAWAYCHVPNGSQQDMTADIENQVERFAPGFRDTIIGRHTLNAAGMESYNPNYVGGDINGGIQDIWQLYSRPVLSRSPYRTPAKGLYICSSSTPPGGGVHGMCGFHAAQRALMDLFR